MLESMFHEPFVLFGYLAGITTSIELVTAVLILGQRQNGIGGKAGGPVRRVEQREAAPWRGCRLEPR